MISSSTPDLHKIAVPGSDKLLLGAYNGPAPSVGFQPAATNGQATEHLIEYDGDAHLITVAPSRSGKGVSVVIPNLLNYRGSIICFDPKGEGYMVAGRHRARFGPVVKLDPCGVVDDQTDGCNPCDILSLRGADLELDAQMLAELLARGIQGTREPFWDLSSCGLHSGLLSYAGGLQDPQKRNLPHIIELLTSDDIVYKLAAPLDTVGKEMSPMAYREIASFLQMPDVTRGGVLATAQSYLKTFMSPRVSQTLQTSTFSLQDVVDGKPLTIFLIIPPDKLQSHRGLLKLWIGTLLKAVLSRRHRPPLRTLFLLDEVAQLGNFPLLETLVTLCAGYGVWVWLFLQDLAQLQTNYPTSWKTILNNCGVVQTFGMYNRDMATQWSGYLDHGPHQLRSIKAEEQILAIHGRAELRCQRLNYLTDAQFQGLFDDNRFYVQTALQSERSGIATGPNYSRMMGISAGEAPGQATG